MLAANVLALAFAVAGASAASLARRDSGQATFYTAGLGACGWTNSGSDFIVAMNAPEWNNGANCGQMITITNTQNGNTQQAQIVDLCPGCSWGSLDMSTGLFGALSNNNFDEGVFPITWSYGSGSQAQQSNNQQHEQQQQQAATSTYVAPQTTYTPTSTWTPSATATPWSATYSQPARPTSVTSAAPQPSSASSQGTVVSTSEWWADVNNACGVQLDRASLPIAITASSLLSADKLGEACGKWIQIKNNQNGKQLSVQVVNYYDGPAGQVAMGEAYKRLANNYENPEVIESVTWGFIDGQGI